MARREPRHRHRVPDQAMVDHADPPSRSGNSRTDRVILDISMSEEQLQKQVVQMAADAGWLYYEIVDWIYKLARFQMKRSPRRGKRWPKPGWPDLTLVQPYSDDREPRREIAMEFKSQKGTVRDAQREWLRSIAAIPGREVYVIRPCDWIDGTVRHILLTGPVDHPATAKELSKKFGKGYVPGFSRVIPYEDGIDDTDQE